MDLQVISIIYVIDDEVANTMELDFVSKPLVGVLWILMNKEIEQYDE